MNIPNKRNKSFFKNFFFFLYKKGGITAAFCFLSFVAYLQENDSLYPQKYYYPSGKISSKGTLVNGIPSGKWRNYYESGILKSEGIKENGQSAGVWIFYSKNGIKEKQITYARNLKNGSYQQFDSTGQLQTESWFHNDTLQGIVRTFEKGRLRSETTFKNGKKDGVEKIFDPEDGRVVETIVYTDDEVESKLSMNRFDKNNRKAGLWRTYYPDGRIRSECLYEQGEVVGSCLEWTPKGILVQHADSTAEIPDVLEVRMKYHPNGKVSEYGAYLGQLRHGVFNRFDTIGVLTGSQLYRMDTLVANGFVLSDGNYDSSWVYFHSNGQKAAQGKYRNSLRTGLWTYYNESGQLIQKGAYRKDIAEGEWISYYGNGQIRTTETFRNGKLEGLKVEYDSLGNKMTEGLYVDNIPDGDWYYFVYDHQESGTYDMGQRTGLWKYYYFGKTLKFKGSFRDDKPVGKHMIYHVNGEIKEVQHYRKNGQKTGSWKQFDDQGNLLHEYLYRKGRLVSADGEEIKQKNAE